MFEKILWKREALVCFWPHCSQNLPGCISHKQREKEFLRVYIGWQTRGKAMVHLDFAGHGIVQLKQVEEGMHSHRHQRREARNPAFTRDTDSSPHPSLGSALFLRPVFLACPCPPPLLALVQVFLISSFCSGTSFDAAASPLTPYHLV